MPSTYRINIPPITELHREEIALRIKMLRAVPNPNEIWFNSRQQVIDYLNDVGVRGGYGDPISKHTLTTWHRKRGFPLYTARASGSSKIVTSNLLIQAWLWAYSVYQATRAHKPRRRWLPYLTENQLNGGIREQ